jgi:branched-chain amino acid transport system ATP-binding protein
LLKVTNLVAGYGKLPIIDDVTLEAHPKQVTVIVGPNGSGKSTLLKSISGLATIFSGTVELEGRGALSGLQPHVIASAGVAYLPQTENVFTHLTVSENLKLAGYTIEEQDYEPRLKEVISMFPQLSQFMGTRANNLSGGERQMLAMGMALVRKPVVMMFDEPTANLAPRIAKQVLSMVTSLAQDHGMTTLLVEQNARRALEIGDQAYLLVNGKEAFKGSAKELLEHKEIGRLYLGLRAV